MKLQDRIAEYAKDVGGNQHDTNEYHFSPEDLQEFSNRIVRDCVEIIENYDHKTGMLNSINNLYPTNSVNARFYEMAEKVGINITGDGDINTNIKNLSNFATSIVNECLSIMENCDGDVDFAIFHTKEWFK
jgi:hypothetical protein